MIAGRAGRRPRRPALQSDRGPAAGHLPRRRVARAGVHRPARAQHLDVGDRRLQRPSRAGVLPVRLPLRDQDPLLFIAGVAFREAERLWYLGLVLARGRLLVRPQPAAQPPRPRAADAARQRGRGVGDGRQRPALQGAVFLVSSMYAGLSGRAVRAVHRQHRAGVLRPRGVDPVPRDDRARRARLRGRRRSAPCSSAPCRWSSRSTPTSLPFVGDPGEVGLVAARRRASSTAWRSSSSILFEPAGLAGLARRFRRPGRGPDAADGGLLGCPAGSAHHTGHSRPVNRRYQLMKNNTKRGRGHARGGRHGAGGHRLQQQGPGTRSPAAARAGSRSTRRRGQDDHPRCPHRPDRRLRGARQGPDQLHTLYWKDHKVCDTYTVKLDVQDTGYVPQTGVQLYSGMKDSVLAMQQTIGSPINTALAPAVRGRPDRQLPVRLVEDADRDPGHRGRRRDVRRRDHQRLRLPLQEGPAQGGRHRRPHLLRG